MTTEAGEVVSIESRRAMRSNGGIVVFALEYLEDIVDRRLEHAVEKVLLAARAPLEMRDTELNFARADYAAAHIIASLVDDRVYDANEWPVFTAWAAMVMQAARS